MIIGPAVSHRWQETKLDELDPVLEGVARYFQLVVGPDAVADHAHDLRRGEIGLADRARDRRSSNQCSRHLSTLYGAGVLDRRKSGNFILYKVSDQTLIEICRTACVHFAARHELGEGGASEARSLARDFAVAQTGEAAGPGDAGPGAGA
ncbi:MAG: hypothetical protein R3E83_12265 [Burkholderiaceae bacterium]